MNERNTHFLTVLGTGNYSDCIYEWGDNPEEKLQTRFAQMATLKAITKSENQNIKITVFLTERARKQNWVAFREELEKTYPNSEIIDASIKEGRNLRELNEIFSVMYDSILENETIYFDLTHGLRNIPIQALTVANHARVSKHAEIGGLYYGAFDLGEEVTDAEGNKVKIGENHGRDIYLRQVPLLDISFCDSILHWTSAAESFITSGSSNLICKTFEEENKKEYKEDKNVEAVVYDLYDLTNCLETSRGKYNGTYKDRSVRKAYEVFKEDLDKMKNGTESESDKQILIRLFDKIEEEISVFDNRLCTGKNQEVLKDTSIGLAAVKWAIHKELTQQGYTALQETIITYVGEKFNYTYDNYIDRERIKNVLFKVNRKGTRDEAWEAYKKTPKNIEGLSTEQEKELEVIAHKVPKEVANCLSSIVDKRNSLNHFGYQGQESEEDVPTYLDLQSGLKEIYNAFVNIIAKTCTGRNADGEKVDINSWKE